MTMIPPLSAIDPMLLSLPSELLTLGSSSLIGGGLKIWSQYLQAAKAREADRDRYLSNRHKEETTSLEAARAFMPNGGEWTRRLIVVACMFALITPTILPALYEGLVVSYAYTEGKGGWWIFQTSLETLKTVRLEGIVILPLHTHTCAAVSGFYFGASIVKWRK